MQDILNDELECAELRRNARKIKRIRLKET